MRYGRSKVIEIGTNRKPVCDFLLAIHCNYTPFRDNDLLVENLLFWLFAAFISRLV